jgi:hypothetical protein
LWLRACDDVLTHLRIGLIAAAVAFIGYLLWREKYLSDKLAVTTRELSTATAMLSAERDNARRANEASERYAVSLENLKAARAATPVRTVRLCVGPASGVPTAGAATGADAAGAEGLPQAAGPDIGAGLYGLADEADECAVRLEALQRWVRDR